MGRDFLRGRFSGAWSVYLHFSFLKIALDGVDCSFSKKVVVDLGWLASLAAAGAGGCSVAQSELVYQRRARGRTSSCSWL